MTTISRGDTGGYGSCLPSRHTGGHVLESVQRWRDRVVENMLETVAKLRLPFSRRRSKHATIYSTRVSDCYRLPSRLGTGENSLLKRLAW
jgi:hypothetical protein